MKLNDKTTVKTLREMIGKKVKTRTSREAIEITAIELTADDTVFIGYGRHNMKHRIVIERISELIAADEPKKEEPKKFKSPIRVAEEKRLKRHRPTPNPFPDNSPKFELGDLEM